MNVTFRFDGIHAVITGGAQGIGLAVAKKFLAAGASVTIWDLDGETLERVNLDLAASYSGKVASYSVDVRDAGSSVRAAAALLSPVNVLINNAGITRDKTFAKMTDEDVDAVIATNLSGAFRVSKAVLPKFTADGPSKRIINVSSIVALYGNFGQTNYAAAKAGIIGMTKSLARELGPRGFTVNAIAPGFVETRMSTAVPEAMLQQVRSRTPLGRLGHVDDIANACMFLASDAASYVNGAVISVDGGLVL